MLKSTKFRICNTEFDRDINAAMNIKNQGLNKSGLSKPVELAEMSGYNTESVKQELCR